MLRRLALALALGAGVAACSAGGSAPPRATPSPAPASSTATVAPAPRGALTVTIRIPAPGTAAQRRARFIASQTKSAQMTFTPATGTATSLAVGLTPSTNPNCTTTSGATVCAVSVPLSTGSYTATITTYDGALTAGATSGAVLARSGGVPVTVTTATANALNLTLYGIPASLSVAPTASYPSPASTPTGNTAPIPSTPSPLPAGFAASTSIPNPLASASSGYALNRCFAKMSMTVNALDADNNVIVGTGAPAYALTSDTATVAVVTPAPSGSRNVFSVVPSPVPTRSATVTLRVTATSGDSGATAVSMSIPFAVSGDLCVKIVAGQPGVYGVQDGTGSQATFTAPQGLAVDASGNLYISEQSNGIVRKMTPSGVVSTVAGINNMLGRPTTACNVAQAQPSKLNGPGYLTIDPSSGAILVTDFVENIVVSLDPTTYAATGIAALNNTTSGSTNGPACSAKFYAPLGIATDGAGSTYIADSSNNQIRKLNAGTVSVLTGQTAGINSIVDGNASTARHCNPRDVRLDSTATYLYVLEGCFPALRRIALGSPTSSSYVTTLLTSNPAGFADGSSTSAKFNNVQSIVLEPAGSTMFSTTTGAKMLVPDHDNYALREVSGIDGSSAVQVTTISGLTPTPLLEGPLPLVFFSTPLAAAFTSDGNTLYVSDDLLFLIRKIY